MAGTIVVDRIESDASYASNINIASQITFSNTVNMTVASTFPAGTVGAPSITTSGDTNTGIFFPAADTIAFSEGGAEAMRIDSSGNVGIGTSSPASLLHVSGSGEIRGASSSGDTLIILGGASGDANRIAIRGASHPTTPNVITINTNSAERMRIDSSGNLLVNATSQIAAERVGISFDRGGQQGLAIKNTSSTSPSNASYVTFFYTSTNTGSINSTGTTTSYATTSDYRLKHDIAPMAGALAKVAALKPVTYTWKSTGEVDEGFIAHELQEVCPSAVTGEKDAEREEQYEVTPAVKDADGNTITEAVMGTRMAPQYQGIDTSFLVATLTAAIQELKAIVDAQAVEIAALKAK